MKKSFLLEDIRIGDVEGIVELEKALKSFGTYGDNLGGKRVLVCPPIICSLDELYLYVDPNASKQVLYFENTRILENTPDSEYEYNEFEAAKNAIEHQQDVIFNFKDMIGLVRLSSAVSVIKKYIWSLKEENKKLEAQRQELYFQIFGNDMEISEWAEKVEKAEAKS